MTCDELEAILEEKSFGFEVVAVCRSTDENDDEYYSFTGDYAEDHEDDNLELEIEYIDDVDDDD